MKSGEEGDKLSFGFEIKGFLEDIFIEEVWGYTSPNARVFTVVVMKDGRVHFKFFSLDQYGDYFTLIDEVKAYVKKNANRWRSEGYHVYFQVLPLSRVPERGRGSSVDVKVGKWLWCDLDYKSVVEKPEFEGYREGEDNSLIGYYREGGKWIKVERPPLTRILKSVEEKLGFKPTIVVDSGAGYHLYFKLKYEVEASKIKRLEEKLVDSLGGDPQSKDLARILRLPGTVNPRLNREVKVLLYDPTVELDPEELEKKLLGEVKVERTVEVRVEGLRELSDTEILRVVELLKEAYKPGYRQHLILYLSGWLAKARVSPLTAVKIAKSLYESTQDQDPLKTRLSAVVYSYKKAGFDLEPYAQAIEALTGVKPYGLETEVVEEQVKGRSGLQEILEEVLGEERALSVIHEISEVLGALSPFKDSIVELMDYEKQLYAVANLRKLLIVRAKRENNTLRYKEKIAVAVPTKVVVYNNPLGGVRKYEITFEDATLRRQLVLGPATIDEIADRLKVEGLVYQSRLLNDVLTAIVQAYIRKGRAEVKFEIESPGFYWVDGKVATVKWELAKIDIERLKQGLLLLNELAEEWFKHAKDRFATVMKWGAIAPFSYILKQRGKWLKWLYLYGETETGKTTLGKIVLKMWGLDSKHEKTGASIDTVPRLGYVLSQSTFPVLVNEPGGAFEKEEIVEAIKNAVETTLVRGKYLKGTYVEIPSLAPVIFTSNNVYPRDDALRRRLIVLNFSFGEKIPLEKQEKFKSLVEPRLVLLKEIGNCIADRVIFDASVLEGDPLSVGEELLAGCYELAGLEKPDWLGLTYVEEEGYTEIILEQFVEKLKKYINDSFARYVSRVIEIDSERASQVDVDTLDFKRRLEILLEKNMLVGLRRRGDTILIRRALLDELGMSISLKSLAEMIGGNYEKISERENGKVRCNYVTTCKLEDLIDLLTK